MLDAEIMRMLDERYAPAEETARIISKATRAVTKLNHKMDQVLPHSLSGVNEITTIFLDNAGSVPEINRLLNEKWVIIAVNQYTFKDGELQEWGTVVVLGKY